MFNLELRRKVLVSFVVGIICGSSVLVLPARVADLWGIPVVAHIPDPVPLPEIEVTPPQFRLFNK